MSEQLKACPFCGGDAETDTHSADCYFTVHAEMMAKAERNADLSGVPAVLKAWNRRALEAEAKVREQDQIIENLGNALNAENGPTFMGEPVCGVEKMRYTHEQLALAYEIRHTYGWSWKRIGLFIGVAPHRIMQAVSRAEILGLGGSA